jgi:hypothetical protein
LCRRRIYLASLGDLRRLVQHDHVRLLGNGPYHAGHQSPDKRREPHAIVDRHRERYQEEGNIGGEELDEVFSYLVDKYTLAIGLCRRRIYLASLGDLRRLVQHE